MLNLKKKMKSIEAIKINEEDIHGMIREAVSNISQKLIKEDVETLCESSWSRILHWMETHDIATITAFRGSLRDVTEGTLIPDGCDVGYEFSLQENRNRNRQLKASLLADGYGVTSIFGSWIEGISGSDAKEVAEESFFVVNLKDDPDFFNKLFKLSEYFNQDSFLFKEKGSDEAVLVGTNASDFPGYGNKVVAGELTSLPSKFMSRIKKAAFAFVDKQNWLVKNKKDDLTDDELSDYTHSYSWREDEKPTFQMRKAERSVPEVKLAEEWLRLKENNGIVLETIESYSPKQRDVIGKIASKVL